MSDNLGAIAAGMANEFAQAAPKVPDVQPKAARTVTKPRGQSFDVIKEAKARLRECKKELRAAKKHVAKLQKENDQLTRLLKAAESEPKPAQVTKIKSA